MKDVHVDIDLDKACTVCGQMGATQSGACLQCIGDAIPRTQKAKRFLKIKAVSEDGRDKIYLEFEKPNGGDYDNFIIKSNDKPAPSFHTALQALAQDVIEMCELPVDYRERIVVKGVSFSYGGEKEVMGATLTAIMKLEDSVVPLNLNTPHKAREFYAKDGDPRQLLDSACARRLDALIIEAEQFVRGVRQQTDMFAGQAQTQEAAA